MCLDGTLWDASGSNSVAVLSTLCRDIASKLQKLQSLKIMIKVMELLTCYKLSQGTELTQALQPLSQLRNLSVFDVRFTAYIVPRCTLEKHHGDCHISRKFYRATRDFCWRQKEVASVWAEEIKDVVLNRTLETHSA